MGSFSSEKRGWRAEKCVPLCSRMCSSGAKGRASRRREGQRSDQERALGRHGLLRTLTPHPAC